MKIDLHSHTNFSDGQLSPQELVDRAQNLQVDVLAITDHDTIAAIAPALDHQASQSRAMTIIPGVELSTAWHNFDIHIIGLGVDVEDSQFLQRLEVQGQSRRQRAQQIGEKLAKAGIADAYQQACSLAGVGQVTRAHFARVLVQQGVVTDMQGAFNKYLGKGKRAHVKPKWISIEQAVAWIQDAGGKAVLAHPGHYDMTTKWLRRLLQQFVAAGGDGMEVVHGQLSVEKQRLLVELAKEHQLQASVGSDFHFPGRWVELGKNLSLPDDLVPIWHDWQLPSVA